MVTPKKSPKICIMKIKINSFEKSAYFKVRSYELMILTSAIAFSFFSVSTFRVANTIPMEPKMIQMIIRISIACGTLFDTLTGKNDFESLTPTFSGLINLKAML